MNKTIQKALKGLCLKCGKKYREPPSDEDRDFHCAQCDECWDRTIETHTSRMGKD